MRPGLGFDDQPRQARVGGNREHLPTKCGNAAAGGATDGAEHGERALGGGDHVLGRALQPAELARVGFAPFVYVQYGGAEVHAMDFGQLEGLQILVFGRRP